jgi:hypothetical protein
LRRSQHRRQTRDQPIAELSRHPIFDSARRFRAHDLAACDPERLSDFLSTRPVLRRAEVPWGGAASDPAVERLFSLMAANSATHAIVLSRSRRSDSACGPRHFRRSGHRNRARTAATPVGLDARGGVTNKAAELIWRVRN